MRTLICHFQRTCTLIFKTNFESRFKPLIAGFGQAEKGSPTCAAALIAGGAVVGGSAMVAAAPFVLGALGFSGLQGQHSHYASQGVPPLTTDTGYSAIVQERPACRCSHHQTACCPSRWMRRENDFPEYSRPPEAAGGVLAGSLVAGFQCLRHPPVSRHGRRGSRQRRRRRRGGRRGGSGGPLLRVRGSGLDGGVGCGVRPSRPCDASGAGRPAVPTASRRLSRPAHAARATFPPPAYAGSAAAWPTGLTIGWADGAGAERRPHRCRATCVKVPGPRPP